MLHQPLIAHKWPVKPIATRVERRHVSLIPGKILCLCLEHRSSNGIFQDEGRGACWHIQQVAFEKGHQIRYRDRVLDMDVLITPGARAMLRSDEGRGSEDSAGTQTSRFQGAFCLETKLVMKLPDVRPAQPPKLC